MLRLVSALDQVWSVYVTLRQVRSG